MQIKGKMIVGAFFVFLFASFLLLASSFTFYKKSYPDRILVIDHLKSLGVAFLKYESTNGYPIRNIEKNGVSILSWRVEILPFVGEKELYQRFRLEEHWNSPENSKLIPEIPRIFQHPRQTRQGCTGIVGFGHGDSRFGLIRLNEPTPILVECLGDIPWSQPQDYSIPDVQLPASAWGDGYFILESDGSVGLSDISEIKEAFVKRPTR